ncbi:Arm DNA-binding domain-containing protein [Streptomyces halobius]|uniref:Arm DNA-binding domain-containing protein n=1 Tax=Streptomyces halobius TaxID=2879846 RepID=A0ABY4MIZ0_9ACTN|nr:Arm DNA-binding domain-containing protein [Streptomyces halobius]
MDESGQPVLDAAGKPKLRELGSACPELSKRGHGSWYYYVKLPDGPRGERRRPRKGGFLTQKKAEEAAHKIWDEAHAGIDIDSKETVAAFLRRWIAKRGPQDRHPRRLPGRHREGLHPRPRTPRDARTAHRVHPGDV